MQGLCQGDRDRFDGGRTRPGPASGCHEPASRAVAGGLGARRGGQWSGAVVLVFAVAWTLVVPQPDILISGGGRNVAVRGKDLRLFLMPTPKDAFLVKEWLAAD